MSLVSQKVTPASAAFVRTLSDSSSSYPPYDVYPNDMPMQPRPMAETEVSPILRWGYFAAAILV